MTSSIIGLTFHARYSVSCRLVIGHEKRGTRKHVAQMGWEKRGANRYYYRKEREGSRVKSVYVGKGEIAHLVSNFESHSAELDKLMRAKKSIEADELERVEATLDRAIELTQLFTEATLLAAGFHTHHRQWRRKRNASRC